jgi:hypothetical protein
VPAAAVIPAPLAYIKVVAVKKLVVEPLAARGAGSDSAPFCFRFQRSHPSANCCGLHWFASGSRHFTLKKLECLRQAPRLNTLAWNNGIGRLSN